MSEDKDFQKNANWAGKRFVARATELLERSQSDVQDVAEDAEREISEWPLSVQVREGWHNPGEDGELEEYEILLSTGGPASRIVGELNEYGEPQTAFFEYQDWFKPWTRAHLSEDEQEKVLSFAHHFYFEG